MTEYVLLRLMRRFIFTDRFLVRFGQFLPYYRVNTNQANAGTVAGLYGRLLQRAGIVLPAGGTLVEIGSGATNTVGYAIASAAWAADAQVVLFEPYAHLDKAADDDALEQHPRAVASRVQRITSLVGLRDGSVDLVLSHSVLEHVREPEATFNALARVLAPTGAMLHVVDYRDHFFKYPYHFLTFSRAAWDRWLDPGDLPRWRMNQHVALLRAAGFRVEVLESSTLAAEFERVRPSLDAAFDPRDPDVAVAQAVLLARRA